MADRIAANQIKVNRAAREWQRANPSPGPADVAEFDALLDAFHEANPVFDEGMTQNIQDAITAGTVAPVAPQAPAAPQVKTSPPNMARSSLRLAPTLTRP